MRSIAILEPATTNYYYHHHHRRYSFHYSKQHTKHFALSRPWARTPLSNLQTPRTLRITPEPRLRHRHSTSTVAPVRPPANLPGRIAKLPTIASSNFRQRYFPPSTTSKPQLPSILRPSPSPRLSRTFYRLKETASDNMPCGLGGSKTVQRKLVLL